MSKSGRREDRARKLEWYQNDLMVRALNKRDTGRQIQIESLRLAHPKTGSVAAVSVHLCATCGRPASLHMIMCEGGTAESAGKLLKLANPPNEYKCPMVLRAWQSSSTPHCLNLHASTVYRVPIPMIHLQENRGRTICAQRPLNAPRL